MCSIGSTGVAIEIYSFLSLHLDCNTKYSLQNQISEARYYKAIMDAFRNVLILEKNVQCPSGIVRDVCVCMCVCVL